MRVDTARIRDWDSFHDITCACDEGSDCPYPITFQVPGLPTETYEFDPPVDATLGTSTRAGPHNSTVTIIVRKRD